MKLFLLRWTAVILVIVVGFIIRETQGWDYPPYLLGFVIGMGASFIIEITRLERD
jgi:hypothetical protein